jgi:hypothetical protein
MIGARRKPVSFNTNVKSSGEYEELVQLITSAIPTSCGRRESTRFQSVIGFAAEHAFDDQNWKIEKTLKNRHFIWLVVVLHKQMKTS